MAAFLFLPFMFLAMFSVSSTETLKPSVIKLEEVPEPAFILGEKNEANPQGEQKNSNKLHDSNAQRKQGLFILGGRPGYSNKPGNPGSFNQQGKPGSSGQQGGLGSSTSQQGKPGSSGQQGGLGSSTSQQGKPGSSGLQGGLGSSTSQQGKPGSSGQQGKPGSVSQQGGLGSPGQQGKPGSSNLQGTPGLLNSQQRKPRSFYSQEEKNEGNPLDGNMESQTDTTSSKNSTVKTICHSIYEPVCGSDGKTYGNRCLLDEAKRLSDGNLSLAHEGKC